MFTVYMATNKKSGKRYIGVTGRGMAARREAHLAKARAGGNQCPRFYDAIRKHGADSFVWTVLCTRKGKAEAYRREFAYVDALKPEYNVMAGGQIGPTEAYNKIPVLCLEDGVVHASATHAAKFYTIDFSDVNKARRGDIRSAGGRHFIDATTSLSEDERASLIAKIDADFVLRRRRVEHRKVAGQVVVNGRDSKGRSAAGPMKNARPVQCIDDGKTFPSIRAAAAYYDVDQGAINELCHRKRFRKTVGGRRFAFVSEKF